MSNSSEPFHEGERAAQRAAGEQDAARQNAAVIADAVTPGARRFLRAQPMLVVASRDLNGRPWASVVFGAPGFVSAGDDGGDEGRLITIDRTATHGSNADVLWSDLAVAAPLGLLAIDLSTRRRLRINGRVEALTGERLILRVEQAYPNCPKYIQQRRLRAAAPRERQTPEAVSEGRVPDAAVLTAVREADTLFVASGHPSRGLDASHRGGRPGFIEVPAPDVLRIPDYAGNGMFNTLGNLLVDPRCGLTVLDFRRSRLHQMSGEATVRLVPAGPSGDPAVTGRSWDVRVQAWRSTELPVQADWEFLGYSPHNPS